MTQEGVGLCCVDGLKRLCGRDVRDPYTADLKSYFDIAMTIIIMKSSFLAIHKDGQVHFSACFLICTTMFVLNHGTEASGLTNVALHKPTAQGPGTFSDVDYQSIPSSFQSLKAVDGVDDTGCQMCTHGGRRPQLVVGRSSRRVQHLHCCCVE